MALWKARGGSLNKDLEFRSWHCGRQGGEVYHGIVQRQGGEVQIKTWNLDHGIVEGKGGKFK